MHRPVVVESLQTVMRKHSVTSLGVTVLYFGVTLSMSTFISTAFPDSLFDLVFIPRNHEKLDALAAMAETENWDYVTLKSDHARPILHFYIQYTYSRLAVQSKIATSDDSKYLAFDTGLVTPHQEPIYLLAGRNHLPNAKQSWHFTAWCRKGQADLNRFSTLPSMATYFTNVCNLVIDSNKEIRSNVEHIIDRNRERFPQPYRDMPAYQLQTFLSGAITNAKERTRRNYKTAIPQFYEGKVQLLLPLSLSQPEQADLALVLEDHGAFYRASTCLPLDWAYSNARQLARPDRDWLKP
jgi:hypothetical protein